MPIPPPIAVDLQDWLEQDPAMIEPAMIDDLELAIALSLQEQVRPPTSLVHARVFVDLYVKVYTLSLMLV